MNDALVPRRGDLDAGLAQPVCVRLALVREDVRLAGNERRRKVGELLQRRAKQRTPRT
jgi:hypothetical protein